MTRPTMRDVAALAGVGLKTVSRVVNDEPNVSRAMRERVRDAVDRLDYQLDLNAGNLKRANGRTLTLGLLVESIRNPFSSAIHRAIEQKTWERDTAVFVASLEGDPSREQAVIQAFQRRRVDGMVLAGGSGSYFSTHYAGRTPSVLIGQTPHGLSADAVISDNYAGAAQAARHLLSYGHRDIAYCDAMTVPELGPARERQRGFMEELRLAGVTAELHAIQEANVEAARNAVAALLRSGKPPTAIFASHSLATIGAIRALREARLSDSVALVGFDDFALADLVEPGVTVIAQDPERIGHIAAERLFARIDGSREEARTDVVPTRLVARGSGELRAR